MLNKGEKKETYWIMIVSAFLANKRTNVKEWEIRVIPKICLGEKKIEHMKVRIASIRVGALGIVKKKNCWN